MPQERCHGCRQLGGRLHDQVSRPFALPKRPVVRQVRAEGPGHGGKSRWQNAVQQTGPSAIQLLAQEPLRQSVVFDVQELVPLSQKIHTARFKPAAQPFPPIERDLNVVGKPGLKPHVHPAVLLVIQVQVQMLALCRVAMQLRIALLGTVMGAIRPARFQARPHTNQSRFDAGLLLPFASQLLLVHAPGVQVGNRSSRFLPCIPIDRCDQRIGLRQHPLLVVAVEHAAPAKKTHRPVLMGQG